MSYLLENSEEATRLERQNSLPQYRVEYEIDSLKLNLINTKILDAGCGSGTLARYLVETYNTEVEGCDFSSLRVAQAKSFTSSQSIRYFCSDLTNMDVADDSYDTIFTRFVLEHTKDPLAICKELKRILRPGGHLVVIDLDGLIFNLHHQNTKLSEYLEKLLTQLPIDLFIGRKLPRMMTDLGFRITECYVKPMMFVGAELEAEIENMQMRFTQSRSSIIQILGEEGFIQFCAIYIEEMRKSQVVHFDKFILCVQKESL